MAYGHGGFGGGAYAAAEAQAYGGPGAVGCHTAPVAPARGFGGGFALVLVVFILLVIIGAAIAY